MTGVARGLMTALTCLAALHAYWGFGGRWPGHDDASMVELVVGRTKGMKAPAPAACCGVALALVLTAGLVEIHSGGYRTGAPAAIGFWGAGCVFLARGLAGFVPALFLYAQGTPFERLNRRVYSPLCLAIAGSFLLAG